jgi:hypothetical protein
MGSGEVFSAGGGAARVYVAGPLSAKSDVRMVVRTLRLFPPCVLAVVSRWHDLPDEETNADPTDVVKRKQLNDMNVADMDRADVLVVWTMTGRPCTTYCEIGYAVAQNKTVFWIQGPELVGANIFDAHPNVVILSHFPPQYETALGSLAITSPTDGAVLAALALQQLVQIQNQPTTMGSR